MLYTRFLISPTVILEISQQCWMIERHSLQLVHAYDASYSAALIESCLPLSLVVGCDDSMVRMWSVSSGQLLSSFSAKKSSVCFSDSFGGVTGKPTLIVDEVCGRTGDGVDPDRTFVRIVS